MYVPSPSPSPRGDDDDDDDDDDKTTERCGREEDTYCIVP